MNRRRFLRRAIGGVLSFSAAIYCPGLADEPLFQPIQPIMWFGPLCGPGGCYSHMLPKG